MSRLSGPRKPVTSGRIRIIGGRFRGTRLDVPDRPGLRPSSDRVRETLFNWLGPHLPGSRCLDLFAGTGALGFEAASRGASSVTLVERDAGLVANLRATAARLGADDVEVVGDDALRWLDGEPESPGFDVVFLDPPFAADLWDDVLRRLPRWLAEDCWLYLEAPHGNLPDLRGWRAHREGQTREVRYRLLRRVADSDETVA